MKIIDVQPKDIYVTTEFSLVQLKWLHLYLSGSKFEYSSEDEPELVEAMYYIVDKLYPKLTSFIEQMENE